MFLHPWSPQTGRTLPTAPLNTARQNLHTQENTHTYNNILHMQHTRNKNCVQRQLVRQHISTCTHTHMYTNKHTSTHAHMHTSTHAHMHTCTQAHMHTCTHAHTCMDLQTMSFSPVPAPQRCLVTPTTPGAVSSTCSFRRLRSSMSISSR